jgi:hypothetical protein
VRFQIKPWLLFIFNFRGIMKKFVKSGILFALPVILFFILAEISLRHIPNQYSKNANYLDAHAKEVEILILGNSHSLYGLDPDVFSARAFNAAHVSQTLDLDYMILQKYSFQNLQTVIVPISYFSLFEKLEFTVEDWRLKNYAIYYNMDIPLPFKERFEIFSKSSLEKLKPNRSERPQINLDEDGKTAAKRHTIPKEMASKIFPEQQQNLERIAKFCQEKKCQVILATMPAWHAYRENMDTLQWQKTLETMQILENEFENLRYFNFLADSQFTANDFSDSDHLNSQGAKKISEILNFYIPNNTKCPYPPK